MENRAFSGVVGSGESPTVALSTRDLEEQITLLSASITVATWRLLMLIAELDRRNAWQQGRALLRALAQLEMRHRHRRGARESVGGADSIKFVGMNADIRFVCHTIARAITRVATPESQDYLLMIARHGTASHVEKLVRAYRHVERLQESARARSTHAQRALRWGFEDDGSMTITVRLPAEQGALVLQAIHAAVDAQWRERDGADREFDSAAREPDATADVSAEASRSVVGAVVLARLHTASGGESKPDAVEMLQHPAPLTVSVAVARHVVGAGAVGQHQACLRVLAQYAC